MKRLEKKIERMKAQVAKTKDLAYGDFKPYDPLFGAAVGIGTSSILLFIPVIGWIAIPFAVIGCPFFGTKLRQKTFRSKLDKELKDLQRLETALNA